MKCEKCGGVEIIKAGTVTRKGGSRQRWQCKSCGYMWVSA